MAVIATRRSRLGDHFTTTSNRTSMQEFCRRIHVLPHRRQAPWRNGAHEFLISWRYGSTPRLVMLFCFVVCGLRVLASEPSEEIRFFEQKIRPLLSRHCYQCHSEAAGEQQGGLLLDRRSGWIEGGETNKAVIPGEPESSLLMTAVRYQDASLQMPPAGQLEQSDILLLERWVQGGAHGPREDMGETEFSRLGDQEYLFQQASQHWAFQPVRKVAPPSVKVLPPNQAHWADLAIDRFVFRELSAVNMEPSPQAKPATLVRRLYFDLTGLPPTFDQVEAFRASAKNNFTAATNQLIEQLIASPHFGEHLGRLWLDVVRYADTDNDYRPDTRTPHYYPFAFTYRDYVIDSFNADKPIDQFLREQLAADLMGHSSESPQIAALGFYAAGPYANRAATEALDDWIDVTTRGLMGITVACARCHDHKFEPVPTADYYSLRGVFAAVARIKPLDEKKQPLLTTYASSSADRQDYEAKRAVIDAKMEGAAGKKGKGNNRSVSQKIRETELAELLLFHPGAPARAMLVSDLPKPPPSFVFVRGDAAERGVQVPRRFLRILDPKQTSFSSETSGRLELAKKIASRDNPLTARVFVNRIWGHLMGSHLVATPSDFGLQGSQPTHPELLDWLTDEFVRHDWSVKHLVRQIVSSETYRQSSRHRPDAFKIDPQNQRLWRANRKHLTIEAIRDSVLVVSGQLNRRVRGHAERLWGNRPTRRRAIYGFINRFNLDPTLRAFDFPASVQTQPVRGESIVASQALFTMNAPFVIDHANAISTNPVFSKLETDEEKIAHLFQAIFSRMPATNEISHASKLVDFQKRFTQDSDRFVDSPWPLMAQAMLMSNEFQYVD